jgi:RNA polymerase sigma factor (sigma-70 family)
MKKIDWYKINALGAIAMQGNADSYEEFLYELSLYLRIKVRLSIPCDHIDDVVQEILIAVHKSFHTFNPKKNAKPWVNAIAHYKVCDFLRSYYKKEMQQEPTTDDLVASETYNVNEKLLIEKLISTLGQNERNVFWMLKYDGKSVEEVANYLGKSKANIKVICFRAIRKMRELLSKEEFDE